MGELLFRKNQTFEAQSNQSKRECAQDLRRLSSENAFLISEINRLREEKTSYQRHSKEMKKGGGPAEAPTATPKAADESVTPHESSWRAAAVSKCPGEAVCADHGLGAEEPAEPGETRP